MDGVDSSADMLACRRVEADAPGRELNLYEQSMEQLDLPRRYRSIYLAGPTFNLLADDATANPSRWDPLTSRPRWRGARSPVRPDAHS